MDYRSGPFKESKSRKQNKTIMHPKIAIPPPHKSTFYDFLKVVNRPSTLTWNIFFIHYIKNKKRYI